MTQKSTKKAAGQVELACSDDGLSNEMWVKTEDVRQKILQTAFVQGIANGTLNPTTFGRYMIQYVVLSQKTKGLIERASSCTQDTAVFLAEEAGRFTSHFKKLWDDWKIANEDGIELGKACREYADYLRKVVDENGSNYFIVALLAATRLWPWLGEQLNGKPKGVYSDWCDEHFNPNSTFYENLQKRVDAMVGMELIDKYKATDVYAHCMDGEFAFFDSLTPRC